VNQNNNFIIIDGYGFIFRAFHVQPPLTSPHGEPIGAVYGFTSMLLKILSDFKPKHAVIVFDGGGKNFRHELDPNYKANRPPVSQDLIHQFPLVRLAAKALNFAVLEKRGYEADDLIASLAEKAAYADKQAIIISADKDLMQLINSHIQMYDPLKNKYISSSDVREKFGVGPENIREVMALMGDKSDNIPGIPGFGPKTAAELISQFGTLENLLNNYQQIANNRQKDAIAKYSEQAMLSWQLVGLDKKVDIEFDIDKFVWQPPSTEKIASFLAEYDFRSLQKRVEKLFRLEFVEDTSSITLEQISKEPNITLEITNLEQLNSTLNKALHSGMLALYLNHIKTSYILHLGVDNINYQIKFEHNTDNAKFDDLFAYSDRQNNYWFIEPIEKIIKDISVKKIIFDIKILFKFFCQHSTSFQEWIREFAKPPACDDLKLIQYLLSAGLTQADLNSAKEENVRIAVSDFKQQFQQAKQSSSEEEVIKLYTDIDLTLSLVLLSMENHGIKVDATYLKTLSAEFAGEISLLEQQIFTESGSNFNIGSPKQLGEVLFDKMQLPAPKLSKSGSYSTGVDVLENLSEKGYRVADLILHWRQFTKLKNTYTDALQDHINPHTGRVHTTFLQTSTSTGRLSSVEPNLQNIPIRSLEGNRIRAAFVAEDGHKLLSADYSQFELRLLASMADIPALTQAFISGEDIHTQTAMRIFQISKQELTAEHRRKAKAINFGIIYGISGFGLARQLNINASEGKQYIQKYLEEFPGIKEYMDITIEYARTHGYVKNLYNRKCFVPTINDKNHILRQIAERAAINAPIQGTNADIIKIAMININNYLNKNSFKTKLLLQIHDELLFEVPNEELEIVTPIIKDIMEKAIVLNVPVVVETKIGNNWRDMT